MQENQYDQFEDYKMHYWDLYEEAQARAALVWMKRRRNVGILKIRAADAMWSNRLLTMD
jgi:hypothetical protein